jgi:SAM-dependent methyltransferase
LTTEQPAERPLDASGRVDYFNAGWELWADMARYYPSAVHRRRLIRKWTRRLQPDSILDVGCGTGVLLEELHARFPKARFGGVDFADATVEVNRATKPWCAFEQLDLGSRALGERFDLVICAEVIEHVQEGDSALDNLVAMTGKHLLITVPTGRRFPTEIAFGHVRHYEINALCAELESRGLLIVRAGTWGFPWMSAFKRATNLRPDATMESFGGGRWGWPKRAFAQFLTLLFYLNINRGPQLLVLAARPE